MHFSQSKSTKCEVFTWHVFIFQEPLIIETQNLCHWIWHTSNPTYMPLKPFQCIFHSQNQQNVKFLPVSWTPPYTKWKKHQFEQGTTISIETWKPMHREDFGYTNHNALCHNIVWLKDILSYAGFSEFLTRRFRHRILKHGVWVEWDARRTAA